MSGRKVDNQPMRINVWGINYTPEVTGIAPYNRALYRLEKFACEKAARVSGITPGMSAAFKKKDVPADKIVLFPNGVTLPGPATRPAPGGFRRRNGFAPDDFLVVYSGNLGMKQGLEILIKATRLLKNPQARIVICGEGARLGVETGAGGLQPLEKPDDDPEDRQEGQDDGQGDGNVDDALEKAVEGILQRLVAEAEKLQPVVLEITDRMGDFSLEIVGDEQAHAEPLAGGGHVIEHVREHRKLDEDDLGDVVVAGHALEIVRAAQHREAGLEAARFVADHPDGVDAEVGLAAEPDFEGEGLAAGADEGVISLLMPLKVKRARARGTPQALAKSTP